MQRMFSLTFIVTRKLSSKGPIDPGNPIWNRYLRTQAIYHCRQNLRQKGNSPWALAWENSRHLATLQLVPPTSPPLQMTSEKGAQKFHTDNASLPSASDWLNQISHAARPIRSPMQIWVVTRHQYGNSVLLSQTSFGAGGRWGEPVVASPNVGCFLRLVPRGCSLFVLNFVLFIVLFST